VDNYGRAITGHDLRHLAAWLVAEAERTNDFLEESGLRRRQIQDLRRQQITPRLKAAKALRDTAALLDDLLIPSPEGPME